MTEFPPKAEQALAGVRAVVGQEFLAAKLSPRKNRTC